MASGEFFEVVLGVAGGLVSTEIWKSIWMLGTFFESLARSAIHDMHGVDRLCRLIGAHEYGLRVHGRLGHREFGRLNRSNELAGRAPKSTWLPQRFQRFGLLLVTAGLTFHVRLPHCRAIIGIWRRRSQPECAEQSLYFFDGNGIESARHLEEVVCHDTQALVYEFEDAHDSCEPSTWES